MKNILIAYVNGLDIIEFDNVVAVENVGDQVNPQIEVYLINKDQIHFTKSDALEFVSQYTDWLELKQAALGIEVEAKKEGVDNV